MKILDLPRNTYLDSSEKGEHQIQMTEVPGSMLTGVTFVAGFFCFQTVKPVMPILPILFFFLENSIILANSQVCIQNFVKYFITEKGVEKIITIVVTLQ